MFLIIDDGKTFIKQEVKEGYEHLSFKIVKGEKYRFIIKEGYKLTYPSFQEIEVGVYKIEKIDGLEDYTLYVYEDNDGIKDFKLYEYKDFVISNNPYDEIYVKDDNLKIIEVSFLDKRIISDSNLIRLNGNRYRNEILKYGDLIEILGTEIYFFGKYLYINNFLITNKLSLVKEEGKVLSFKKREPKIYCDFIISNSELKLDKLSPFNKPRMTNNRNLIFQIGPAITMSLTMGFIAFLNIYNSYINNGYSISLIAMGIMPLSIILSGVMWPTIIRKIEDKKYIKDLNIKRKEYLKYLRTYLKDNLKYIDEYKEIERQTSFNLMDVEDRLFYVSKNSRQYLNVTLGTYTKDLDFSISKYDDERLDSELISLKNKLSKITELPLYLSLKNNKKVTFIAKDKIYYFKKILLELSYKYDFKDLRIIIYAKDERVFKEFCHLPHLFEGGIRTLYSNEVKLSEINQFKDDRDTIVLLLDEINTSLNSKYSIIYFTSESSDLYKDSNVVIKVNDYTGEMISKSSMKFKPEYKEIDFKYYFDLISRFKLNIFGETNSFISFFKDLDVKGNYLLSQSGLRADFSCVNNDLLSFDLHESKDGPHGLIGGSTGSGKSELIVSLLLSLAFRYRPDYLNFILIDYKGGGIKESLSYERISIPHIIASLDNLEEDKLDRLIVAIDKDLKNRQRLFQELSKKSSTSIMNIDDYLQFYEKYNLKKLAHLLIVVDEFAELKKNNPEVIKELISFSRIGRSLGVHLILATQRPSGVIDEEIFSNSHFKIALKVHSEKDSQDIIKETCAADLKYPGDFYLKEDDRLLMAHALYAKKDINNNSNFEVSLLDTNLRQVSKYGLKSHKTLIESNLICQRIIETSKNLNIKGESLDYLSPSVLTRKELIEKYSVSNRLVFGQIDDYLNSKKELLSYSLQDNLLIVSDRQLELEGIISNLSYFKKEMIIIASKKYDNYFIRDSILFSDEEDIDYLFNKLITNTKDDIHILIEDLNYLLAYGDHYLEILLKLLRISNLANFKFIILSNSSNINFKLLNSIKNKLLINFKDKQDLINIFSMKSNYKGSSFFNEVEPITFVPVKLLKLKNSNSIVLSYLDKVPKIIYREIRAHDVLIGYDNKSRKKIYINNKDRLLITGFDGELIEYYKKLFSPFENIRVALYSLELLGQMYDNILWLKEGIYSQKLFYPDRSVRQDEEYILYRQGRTYSISVVNHE